MHRSFDLCRSHSAPILAFHKGTRIWAVNFLWLAQCVSVMSVQGRHLSAHSSSIERRSPNACFHWAACPSCRFFSNFFTIWSLRAKQFCRVFLCVSETSCSFFWAQKNMLNDKWWSSCQGDKPSFMHIIDVTENVFEKPWAVLCKIMVNASLTYPPKHPTRPACHCQTASHPGILRVKFD